MIKTIYNSINIKTVKIQFISVKRILADLKAIFYIERILSLEFFKLGRNVIKLQFYLLLTKLKIVG